MKIEDLLVDPISMQQLVLDQDSGSINNLNLELFQGKISDGIPVVLPKGAEAKPTSLHQKHDSEFDYVDHYIKDAVSSDYFQAPPEITENERMRLNQLIIHKIKGDAKRILDVGCGNGWLSKMLQNDRNQVVSLDISLINVKRVLQNTPHPNHSGLVADVFNLPIQSNSFDTIVASEIIEHVHDPKEFIASLLNVLKPGGRLIISTPYNEQIPLHLCVHCNRPTPENAHLHSFNESNIFDSIPNNAQVVDITKSTNKHLLKLRAYMLIRSFPFNLWRLIDKLAIKLLKRPTRLILEITK
ncbi:MAG: class I SAM-dependent methyltransferase [Saprospiraceae bacterium]